MEQHTFINVNNCLNTNIYSYLETSGGQSSNLLSCKIFEHFALETDPVTEFIKLGSAPLKEGT